jgi:hypothetical protein
MRGPKPTTLAAFLILALTSACSTSDERADRSPEPSPSPSPSTSSGAPHPGTYFNLTEEDALNYIGYLMDRAGEAVHAGDLGALQEIYTEDGPARRHVAGTIIRDFQNGWINSTDVEVVRTRVLRITSQLAVFEQVRLVRPCVYDFNTNLEAGRDHHELRQVVTVYMADEFLNWRIDREMVGRSEPTGQRVPCPPK